MLFLRLRLLLEAIAVHYADHLNRRVVICAPVNSFALPREAGLEHAPHQLFEVMARLARGHRHQAVTGHAGGGVDLYEKKPAACAVAHEIDAPPTGTVGDLEC